MTTQHDKPKRWRPWQFSLRTLLIIMIFASGYFAGIGTYHRRAQRMQQEAIQEAMRAEAEREAKRIAESKNRSAGVMARRRVARDYEAKKWAAITLPEFLRELDNTRIKKLSTQPESK